MINNFTGVGRLTKDVELRYTPTGVAVANFTVAINRPFTNQQGERDADFVNVRVWRKPAENCANFIKKGSLVGIIGRYTTENFEGQDGQRVYLTFITAESVQFLDSKGKDTGNQQNGAQGQQNAPQNAPQNKPNNAQDDPFANNGQPIDINDEDLPF